jgi:hypothetical protein
MLVGSWVRVRVTLAVLAACTASSALASRAVATPTDAGSSVYTVTGTSYDFILLNSGQAPWQYFSVVGPPGTTFVGGATVGEITAHCVAGQPDGVPNEIQCGPLSANGAAPGVRLVFVATVSSPAPCGTVFGIGASSTGSPPVSIVADATSTGACSAAPPVALHPPTLRGTPVVGHRIVAIPPVWSASPTSVTYAWQRCVGQRCQTISGATRPSLRLTGLDAGRAVRFSVTAEIGGGAVRSTSSALEIAPR